MTETSQTSEIEVDQSMESNRKEIEQLSTGIDVLDRKLDGGVPAGRMIALLASPACQSELFLYEMAAARETVYLTAERTKADVETELENAETPLHGVDVRRLGREDPIDDARAAIEDLPAESMLVVDPVDRLEGENTDEYHGFLNDVKARTAETGGFALLHCLDEGETPTQRNRTKYHADIIFDLVTKLRGGSIENQLSIPKFRGGRALSDAIELDLTTDVTIDVSRKIA